MPFSHHSHSGQFCGHATSTLEEVVQAAISKGMTTLCLTEHIPRDKIDFYPEEEADYDEASLKKLFDDYYTEARRLQTAYREQIQLFVGFEGEWIRQPRSLDIIQDLLAQYDFELFVGSVHHVHTVPIDYDMGLYHKARELAGGTDERIFEDYFDAQLQMLRALRPPVVGHFDLIRLKSDDPDRNLASYGDGVWQRVLRNLRLVAEYGGVLEVNGSALRKGLKEAYPQVAICREFKAMGGRFTLSDDSHGVGQIGLNYRRVRECIEEAGIVDLCYLSTTNDETEVHDRRFPEAKWQSVAVEDLAQHGFWKQGEATMA